MSLLVLGSAALAQTSEPETPAPMVLTDQQTEYPLGLYLDILEDSSGELTIDEVASQEFEARFIRSQVEVPNFGFTDAVYWIRLSLDNQTSMTNEWLLKVGFSNMQYIDLYTPLPNGEGFDVKQTGSLSPVSTRDIPDPYIVLKLVVPTQSQQTFYLRFKNGASMTLPLSLWTKDAYYLDSKVESMLHWLFFGALFALLVYHLFLLLSLRETSYLFFVIMLASLIFEELSYSGYLEVYFFPDLSFYKQFYYPLAFGSLIASMVLFSDVFLELKSRLPLLHWVTIVTVSGWAALTLLIPFATYHTIANLMAPWAVLSLISILAAGLASWWQGFHPARFFMIAWFGLIASLIIVLLVRLGLLSSTLFTENSYKLGMIWMCVCWSIALVDRINLLKGETEVANQKLRNSERRLTQILDGMPLGVVLYGTDQKPKYLNKRTEEILSNPAQGLQPDIEAGRTLDQALKYYAFQEAGDRKDYPLEEFPVFLALRGEPAFADNIEMDRGEDRVPLEIWASPVKDDQGNVESAVVAFQDITQRKQAEAELIEHRNHLEGLVEIRTAEVNLANEKLKLRFEWMSAVNKVHQTIAGVSGLTAAYDELSANILHLLQGKLVFIIRWEDQKDHADILQFSLQGGNTNEVIAFKALFEKDTQLRSKIGLGKNILLSVGQADVIPNSLIEISKDHDIHAVFLAPLTIRQSVMGVLGVLVSHSRKDAIFHQTDLIERMAFDLASLTEDAILLDQALALATVEERNRLARDLHDSVTQTLFTASVLAEATPRIWEKDRKIARQNMEKLSLLIRGALAEMRNMLIELRSGELQNQTLDRLLITLVEAARARSRAVISLSVMDLPELPENVTLAFFRIAREALNNIIIHAEAAQIDLSLLVESDRVELTIRDDGCGFDPLAVEEGHLGIKIMNERAVGVGGALQINSEPGHGTEIVVTWPGLPGESAENG